MMQFFNFIRRQIWSNLSFNTRTIHNRQQTEAYVLNTKLTMQHGRNCHERIAITQNALNNMAGGNGNGIECCAFTTNNLTAGSSHVFFNFFSIEDRCNTDIFIIHNALSVVIQRNTGNRSQRPRNERSIAMFTKYIRMHIFLADT